MTKEINDQNFAKNVLESKIPVLVDFWAPWCGPCRQLAPIIDDLATELSGKIDIVKCNIDENPETPSKYGVRSIPTLMIFKNGQLLDTKIGSLPKSALNEWLKKHI